MTRMIKKLIDNLGCKKYKKNDSNLSLNSTPNSKIENNSDWGI
jgi:hypothetical protein